MGSFVDIDDAALRRYRLGDLVGVVGGGQAGADVEELADAGVTGQIPDHAGEEGPGGASVLDDRRKGLENLVADLAVDGEVVLAAQPVVPDPGRLGHVGVELGRYLAGGGRVVRHGIPHLLWLRAAAAVPTPSTLGTLASDVAVSTTGGSRPTGISPWLPHGHRPVEAEVVPGAVAVARSVQERA